MDSGNGIKGALSRGFYCVQVNSVLKSLLSTFKAGFHWRRRRSRSRSRSRKRASDLAKIENRSRKRSHKLGGIGVGRIRTVPFSSDSAYMTPTVMIQWKLDCRSRKQKRKNQPITMPCLFFGFRLRLGQSSFHWSHKRRSHKRNRKKMEPFWLCLRLRFSIFTRSEALGLRLRLRLRRQWKPAFTRTQNAPAEFPRRYQM